MANEKTVFDFDKHAVPVYNKLTHVPVAQLDRASAF